MTGTSYRVTHRAGLTIVEGSVPLGEMVALLGDHSEEKVIDTHLASALNASLVIGTPQACASEKARLGLTRHPPAKLAQSDTDTQVAAWLGRGETGLSSETIARYLTGQDLGGLGPAGHLPADASDFDRCCLLLDWAPGLRDRLTELRTLSPAWAGLVEVWGELEALRDAGGQGALLHARLQVIRNLEGSPDVR